MKKYREGNDLARFLMGTIFLVKLHTYIHARSVNIFIKEQCKFYSKIESM